MMDTCAPLAVAVVAQHPVERMQTKRQQQHDVRELENHRALAFEVDECS